MEKTYTDTSKEKEIYWEKSGESTELSFTDGKISAVDDSSYAYAMCKLDDTYLMYLESEKFSRISGSGLYSTFSRTGNSGILKITFNEDGIMTYEVLTFTDSHGNIQSSLVSQTYTYIYKNNNGLISVYSGREGTAYCYYDGSAIYQTMALEEVSGLPTVKETTE